MFFMNKPSSGSSSGLVPWMDFAEKFPAMIASSWVLALQNIGFGGDGGPKALFDIIWL